MAFAHKVNRVTISGTMFGGEEEWSTGFYFGYTGGDADLPDQTLVDGIGPLWQTFFTNATSRVSNQWKTSEIKVAQLGTDGKTIPDSPVYYTYPAPITGAYNSPSFPPQCALVATLVGPLPRGLASKGRMFLPGIVGSVDSNGRLGDTDRGTICTNIKTFLTAVNALPANNVVVLASKGSLVPGGSAPIIKAAISVRVGNVYDTQRRRRNALTEVYSTATL